MVRTVSAQIANEPDIDELARKVTALIQSTFKYYYVGIFTLEPGDLILTGTPAGVGPIKSGDTVIAEISQVGRLTVSVR